MGENLALLLATAIPLMGSPGPATLSLAALGSAFGWRASLPYLGGIVLGTSVVLGVVASGVSGLLLASPTAVTLVAAAGSIYILYLAWRIATAPPLAAGHGSGRAPSLAGGLLLGMANPKAYAAIGAVYSSRTLVADDLLADGIGKVTVLFVTLVVVNSLWLLFGSLFASFLADARLSRLVNLCLAALLVLSVVAALLI